MSGGAWVQSEASTDHLSEIRAGIFSGWDPARLLPAGAFGESALRDSWREIHETQAYGLWDSFTTQVGKAAEGFARFVLMSRGVNNVGKLSLHRLLQHAEAEGLIEPGPMSLNGDGVPQHLRRVRNLAAHFDIEYEPSEFAGTQALCSFVAFAEVLALPWRNRVTTHTPVQSDVSWLSENFASVRPYALIQQLTEYQPGERSFFFATVDYSDFYDYALQDAPFGRVIQLTSLVRLHDLPVEPLRVAVRSHFLDLIRNSAFSTALRAARLRNRLAGYLRLPQHGRIVGAMLPIDSASLIYILDRLNPHKAARYVNAVARSSPAIFRQAVREIDADALTGAFWGSYDGSTSYVSNRLVLIARFPPSTRLSLVESAPPGAITRWNETGLLTHVTQVAYMRYQSLVGATSDEARGERRRILLGLTTRLDAAPIYELRNIPFLLSKLGVSERGRFGRSVYTWLFRRARDHIVFDSNEQLSSIRILWDLLHIAPARRLDIERTIRRAIEASIGPSDCRDYWAMCGIGAVLTMDLDPAFVVRDVGVGVGESLRTWLERATPYEACLAVVGATQVLKLELDEVPVSIVDLALVVMSNPTADSYSRRLLDSLFHLVDAATIGAAIVTPHADADLERAELVRLTEDAHFDAPSIVGK